MKKSRIIIVLTAFAAFYASQSSHAALTTYFRFDDNSGTTAIEATGLAGNSNATLYTGNTVGGPTWVTGQLGSAVHFTAASLEHARAQTFIKPTTSMTFSAWVNAETLGSDAKIASNWGNTHGSIFQIGKLGGSNLQAEFGGGLQPSWGTGITTGVWTYVTLVADASTQKIQLYRNGAPLGAAVSYNGTLQDNAASSGINVAALGIGTQLVNNGSSYKENLPSYFWNGTIDDLGIFNSALSSGQVKAVYNLALQSTVTSFQTSSKYDLGQSNQLFTAYAATGATTVAGDSWSYVTNLGAIKGAAQSGDLFTSGGQTYLLLDGANNTGMALAVSSIPEPSSIYLMVIGLTAIFGYRRRITSPVR